MTIARIGLMVGRVAEVVANQPDIAEYDVRVRGGRGGVVVVLEATILDGDDHCFEVVETSHVAWSTIGDAADDMAPAIGDRFAQLAGQALAERVIADVRQRAARMGVRQAPALTLVRSDS